MAGSWWILVLAGLAEVGWAVSLKFTRGFTRPLPSILTVALTVLSFVLLARAYRDIPMGTAYAVWTGIGAVGVAVLGMLLFGEPRTLLRLICLAAIIGGIVGLRLTA